MTLYLRDGNDTLYLAEEVDPRHMPAAGPLYRLTPVDTLAAARASLAATAAWLAEHKESGTTQPPDRAGEADGPSAVAPRSAPSSTAAPSLLGTGSAGAVVDPIVGGGGSGLPRPADRLTSPGATSAGGAS